MLLAVGSKLVVIEPTAGKTPDGAWLCYLQRIKLVLPSKNQKVLIIVATHLVGFVSLVLAGAYTCKAMTLSYAVGATLGAVLYLLLLVIMWE
ncbi:MAG TPA: hypothetical protein VLB68_11520 [Pyrinomonadaceae bacterium]|nr:hypothetical protein [Pyrinomonadaceae bacterium]